jgi:hypothetical protein
LGEENILDETLVDAHLVLVPGLGTLTVGGLTGGDLKGLGGKTDGTLDMEGLGASTVDELGADLLEGSDLARGEGDTDLVNLLLRLLVPSLNCHSVASIALSSIMDEELRMIADVQGPRQNPSRASGKTSCRLVLTVGRPGFEMAVEVVD